MKDCCLSVNLSVSALCLRSICGICSGTEDTLTAFHFSLSFPFPSSLPHTDRPLCAGTDEICMHVRLDYTCRLWEPGPLWSPSTVSPHPPCQKKNEAQALLSISSFKQISQLNWLRNTQNRRLNSWIFWGRVGEKKF